MYHSKNGDEVEEVDLEKPLMYADRFRIRHPGVQWDAHPPHVDGTCLLSAIGQLSDWDDIVGGGIERWEDKFFRGCFADILSGNWREHDPYDLQNRIHARSSLYKRPNQVKPIQTCQRLR